MRIKKMFVFLCVVLAATMAYAANYKISEYTNIDKATLNADDELLLDPGATAYNALTLSVLVDWLDENGTQATLVAGADYQVPLAAGTDYLAPTGDGSGLSGVVTAESDPIVGAVTGIVKADGGGNISAASAGTDYQAPLTAGTDYLAPNGDGANLTNVIHDLALSDNELLDLSAITMSGTNDEGLALPYWANITPTTDKRYFTWDDTADVIKVYKAGTGWITINPSAGAPTDVA